jgi:hypothetical protein
MKRRDFLKTSVGVFAVAISGKLLAKDQDGSGCVITSPYADVEWDKYGQYKANLHMHTTQSDGKCSVSEAVDHYIKAGFTILAISDHDWNYPKAKKTPYPLDPKPANFPANTTWPWNDYGCKSPEELDIVGVEANELTFRHHINSFFNDYGVFYKKTGRRFPFAGIVDKDGKEVHEDDQLAAIAKKNGLAIMNHPSVYDDRSWWMRHSLSFYVDRFKNNPASCLVGMEIGNNSPKNEAFDLGLWDQLLARFMPQRPIWGFCNDDSHSPKTKQSFNRFVLAENNSANVRKAMEKGQFYSCLSTKKIDYATEKNSLFPTIDNIAVDHAKGTITIDAKNYDEIRWITVPGSLEPIADYKTSNAPFPLGQVVGRQTTIDCTSDKIQKYIRAELTRKEGKHTHRVFTNPFGVQK